MTQDPLNRPCEPHMGNPRGVRPAWVNPILYPFTSHFMELDGHTIHYLDEGPRDAPILLWLHGNPAWSFEFRHLITALSPAFRCIAPDMPGFGLSSPAANYDFLPEQHVGVLDQFIKELDLQGIVSYHHDWSGPIGLALASRNAHRWRGLVIGSTWARPDIGGFQRFSAQMLDNAFGRYLVRRHNIFIERFLSIGHELRKPTPDELEHYRGPFPDAVARDRYHLLNRHIVKGHQFLSEVQKGLVKLAHLPALLTWPDKDIAFPVSEMHRFQQIFKRNRVVMLHGAGHFSPEDAPEQIVLAIRSWVRDLELGNA
jgi:haloalkane dehalogenase